MDDLRNDLMDGAEEAADYIGFTPRQVYHFVETGQIPCTRLGKKLIFSKTALRERFSPPASKQEAA